MNKVLQDLSLCKRAGKLIMGFDVVKQSLQDKTAVLLVTAKDISPKTAKEVEFLATKYQKKIITVDATLDELWYLVGKRVGVIAVTDQALGDKIQRDHQSKA